MNLRVFALIGACSLLSACGSVELGAPTLAGDWKPVDATWGGQDYPVANWQGTMLHLTGNGYTFGIDHGSYTTLAGRSPSPMDIHGTDGPNAGHTIPAIYSLASDRLAVCYQLGAGERPADFTSPAGTRVLLVHYRRAP